MSMPHVSSDPLLEVHNLCVEFASEGRTVKAVDDISFSLDRGRVIGIVGESGSGKSVTSTALLRLVRRPGRIVGGDLSFEGRKLLLLTEQEILAVRGRGIALINQDPHTSLNPVMTVGRQLTRVLRLHRGLGVEEANAAAIEALRQVEIPAAERRIHQYPHELSGGMCQRVMIAMAMAPQPKLLIADEPTTALDVTVQSQILSLLQKMREEHGVSIIFISHDIALVSQIADDVLVMYAGREMERGPVDRVLSAPTHPYTQMLLRAMPHLGASRLRERVETIPGQVPSPTAAIRGCVFAPRCPSVTDRCRRDRPSIGEAAGGLGAACWLVGESGSDAASTPIAAESYEPRGQFA